MEYVTWAAKDSTKSKFEERVFRWGATNPMSLSC
jgi:hypothetical protein